MKKFAALFLSLLLVLTMTSALAETDITLWTFPIGDWGNSEKVDEMLTAFNAVHPDIKVTVEYLDYTNGDAQITTAIEAKTTPDIVMEGPERLVANWAAAGKMLPLNDLWTEETIADINANNASVVATCQGADGNYYMYPLCMTAHCMVINKTAFEAADAMQYIDQETHTWTAEGFENALRALVNAGYYPTGLIYCSGQGGDQGTRALVNNLYGGMFTNAEHTAYTADSPENIKALELLQSMDGIYFNAAENGGEEITAFRQGILKMAFCWNIAQQLNADNNDAELTNDGEKIVFMSFPSETGESKLQGGIWGFGVFDNGDAAKIDAAKTFIKYFADGEGTIDAVKASKYFAVRDTAEGIDLTGIWADNAIMNEYTKLMPYLGDYYQVTSGWATARTEWWNMLQRIGGGGDVATEVATFCANANAAAAG